MTEVHFLQRVRVACETEYNKLDRDFRDFSQLNGKLHARLIQEFLHILLEVLVCLKRSIKVFRDPAAPKKRKKGNTNLL